jgi:hypothetical protein
MAILCFEENVRASSFALKAGQTDKLGKIL